MRQVRESQSLPDRWVEYFFGVADRAADMSKDPSSRVGSVVVSSDRRILSTGWNGFPRGIEDSEERLNDRETKYRYVVHAEMNAIYNATRAGVSLRGSSLFIVGVPLCSECAKGVIQVGVERVYMRYPLSVGSRWMESLIFTEELLKEAGVWYRCYEC